MKVYALSIETELSDTIFHLLLAYTSSEKHERILKYRKKLDAVRALLSDLLVRAAIIENLEIQNSNISFNYNKYGKPFLNNNQKFHFNVSHSGNWVVCAIDNNPIGIDIEKIDKIDLNISNHFFSNKESIYLMNQPCEHRLSYFYDLWTLKESYIKALGCGLSLPLNSFSIKLKDSSILLETDKDLPQYFFKQYNIDCNYKMSVCSFINAFPNSIFFKSIDDILGIFHI
jgi:4'-phosphopantetheinyl transferase